MIGNNMKRLAATFFLWLALLSAGFAENWEAANEAFDKGNFAEAKKGYEQQIESGDWSANLFYNLGNVDYRLGASGRAILNYERALALDPSHPEARANLQLLRQQTGAKLPALPWFDTVVARPSINSWTVVGAVAAWVTIFALTALIILRSSAQTAPWLALVFGVLTLAVSGLALARLWQDQALGIVTAREAEARLAPAESAKVAESLPAGSRVRVLSERGDWVYCELPSAGRGWISREAVERVRLSHS